jgi:hypothetical protein
MTRLLAALFAVFAVSLAASPAAAQATRTWVSGVGDDANPCSRTAPCKTFAGAISKTAANGQISVLDPGGYGSVTITKSISIVAEGSEAGTLAPMTNGITVNAQPGDAVYIRGLTIEGAGTGLVGVKVLGAKSVVIEDTVIRGFRGADGAAVRVAPTAGPASVTVVNSTLADSAVGVAAEGAAAQVWVTGSTVTGNASAFSVKNGGQLRSYGDNAVHANGADGAVPVRVSRR